MTSSKTAAPERRVSPGQRRLITRAAVLLALCAPMQLSMAQEIDQMINECLQGQNEADKLNAQYMDSRRATDPYLNAVANKPVSTSGTGDGGFSCYDTTKGAIDGLLQQASGMFGVNLGALFGGSTGGVAGGACNKARQAIGSEFRKGLLSAGVDGAIVNSATHAAGGVLNGGQLSTYKPGLTGAATGAASRAASNYAPPAAKSATGGAIRSLGGKMTCFLAGKCPDQ